MEEIPIPSGDSDTLSQGAMAGIALGCIGALLLAAGLVYFFCFREKSDRAPVIPPTKTPVVGSSL